MATARRKVPYVALIGALVAVTAIVIVVRAIGSNGETRSASAAPTTTDPVTTPTPRAHTTPSPAPTTTSPSPGATNVYAAITSPTLDPAVAGDPQYLYVPNGIPGTVEVIDPRTYRIVRTIKLGYRTFPEHVTPSWDLRWLYVDTSAASELAQIDPRTGKLVRIIHGVEHPYNLYFSPDGRYAIDVAEYYDQLRFHDPHTWKLIKTLPLPCNGPDHLDFSADGSYLMIGCEFDATSSRSA